MNIGDLFFSLRANDARLQSDVKKAGDKAGVTLGKSLNNSFRSQFSGKNLGQGIAQGLGLAGGLGIAGLAASAASSISSFVDSSIEAASNLNETISKSGVIFGDNADEVEAWANTMASAFGQSKRAALDTASTFAGLFETVGIAEDEAADKAIKLTELGSDLASFFNTDVQTAIDALRSGLSGESEPLRRFNVFLSETAVSAKLVEMGQRKVNGQWTEAQKVAARYAIILEQTTAAQGDFARTADGLANSQRKVDAQLENTQAILGQQVLPLQLAVTQAQLDFVEGLALVGGAVDTAGTALGNFANDATTVLDILTFWDKQTHFFATVRLPEQSRALYKTGAAAESIGVDARDARKAIGGMGDAMGDAEDAAVDLESALDDLADEARDAASGFGDAKFSATELAGRMSELEQQIIDAKKELSELKAIKDPTAEQRRDIAITRGEIAGYEHDLFETRLELALLNGTGLDALLKDLAAAQYRTDLLGKEAREALTVFQKLSFAQKKVTGYNVDPGFAPRASGGDVYRGSAYLVGEKGPEMFVPDTSGYVHSTADTMRGWGGNTYEYHIHGEGQLKIPDPLAAANTLARFQGAGLLPEAD